MRVIGGKHKGARLKTRKSSATRPLLARVKKSLFSIILPQLPGSRFLDLFAGTGAVGIEALSRGSRFCVFVDQNYQATQVIKENLRRLALNDKARILSKKVSSALNILQKQGEKFDIIFIGAPYTTDLAVRTLFQLADFPLFNETTLVIAEVRSGTKMPPAAGNLHLTRQESYGDSSLLFYRPKPPIL